MIGALGLAAASSAFLFAGASIYISLVEHPARLSIDTKSAALQWAPSYRRATYMQASLALIGLLTGVTAWLLSGVRTWLVAAILIGLVVPFTFLVIMPTNHELLAPGRDLSTPETRRLLERWGRLHWVRSLLGLCASAVYLWGVSGA
jgi:hypothetical protein